MNYPHSQQLFIVDSLLIDIKYLIRKNEVISYLLVHNVLQLWILDKKFGKPNKIIYNRMFWKLMDNVSCQITLFLFIWSMFSSQSNSILLGLISFSFLLPLRVPFLFAFHLPFFLLPFSFTFFTFLFCFLVSFATAFFQSFSNSWIFSNMIISFWHK